MPYKSNNTNQQSSENHGDPAGEGQSKAGVKPVGAAGENEGQYDELSAKYTADESGDEPAQDLLRHKNRNLDKPQLDKPRYS
jgi:hypothetical protein